ncbi:hypothetical protein [Mycoplasma sp. HU2014]|uniref:hypothetical protein n=1 Tax=Mycoplasma sp. HU2014 TaxID=1664275 RepID=UPI00067E40A0|nr:hypothetical protein [Mycoplasma sp. HU2014]KNG79584.1 hypothetical protein AB668_01190 [Mycoplasma sp. HU2014]
MKKVIIWSLLLLICTFFFFEYWYLIENFVPFAIKGTKDGREFILSSRSPNFISEWNELLGVRFNTFTPIADWKEFIVREGYELTGYFLGNSIIFEFLEKLKYLLGSLMVLILCNIYRITIFKTFKNVKAYLKNRNDFIVHGYKDTINYLEEFKNKLQNIKTIKQEHKDDIKKMCENYKEMICRPIFVTHLIDDIWQNLISEKNDLSLYIQAIENVIELVKEIYRKEKKKMKKSGGFEEWVSGLSMSFQYNSHSSSYYKQYINHMNWLKKRDVSRGYILNIPFIYTMCLLLFPISFITILLVLFMLNLNEGLVSLIVASILIPSFILWICSVSYFILMYQRSIKNKKKKNEKILPIEYISYILLSFTSVLPFVLIKILQQLNQIGYNVISEIYTPKRLDIFYIYFLFILLLSYSWDILNELYMYKKYDQKISYKIWFFEFFLVILLSLTVFVLYGCCLLIKNERHVVNILLSCRIFLHLPLILIPIFRITVNSPKTNWIYDKLSKFNNKLNFDSTKKDKKRRIKKIIWIWFVKTSYIFCSMIPYIILIIVNISRVLQLLY